jgi:hypothetical protein
MMVLVLGFWMGCSVDAAVGPVVPFVGTSDGGMTTSSSSRFRLGPYLQ